MIESGDELGKQAVATFVGGGQHADCRLVCSYWYCGLWVRSVCRQSGRWFPRQLYWSSHRSDRPLHDLGCYGECLTDHGVGQAG